MILGTWVCLILILKERILKSSYRLCNVSIFLLSKYIYSHVSGTRITLHDEPSLLNWRKRITSKYFLQFSKIVFRNCCSLKEYTYDSIAVSIKTCTRCFFIQNVLRQLYWMTVELALRVSTVIPPNLNLGQYYDKLEESIFNLLLTLEQGFECSWRGSSWCCCRQRH